MINQPFSGSPMTTETPMCLMCPMFTLPLRSVLPAGLQHGASQLQYLETLAERMGPDLTFAMSTSCAETVECGYVFLANVFVIPKSISTFADTPSEPLANVCILCLEQLLGI